MQQQQGASTGACRHTQQMHVLSTRHSKHSSINNSRVPAQGAGGSSSAPCACLVADSMLLFRSHLPGWVVPPHSFC